ncbi:MAG: PIG-L family deacetylase [Isosphaeraceae bacterium]
MNVLFVGAHPDDEMACLGTLLLYRRRGDTLSLVCATNGDRGMSDDPDFPLEECARIREGEMREVARELGASYTCLGEPDEALYDTWENRLKLIEAIRRARPDVVFTHYPQDYNLDHTATSTLVFQASLLTQIASVRTESPALPRVPPIFYVDPGPGYGFEATHFVEIDEAAVREARRLLGLHESQMAVSRRLLGKDYRDSIEDQKRATGVRVGVPFAEAFRPCLASRRTPLARLLP